MGFIHVDPEMSAQLSPWKTTIAHGFLTLSLLTHLDASIPKDMSRYEGVVMGVNYGFDKVRFVNPVKVGQRIRATSVLTGVDLKDPNSLQVTRTLTVEVDGESKPAVVADWITRLVTADPALRRGQGRTDRGTLCRLAAVTVGHCRS